MVLANWMQLGANFAVILGVGFAAWQIHALRADRSRDNAMQYVLQLHGDSIAGAALDLSTSLQEHAPPGDPRLSLRNIQRLGDFYQSVLLCRASHVCDAETIDANFHEDIEGFYRLTHDHELVQLSCRLGMAPAAYGSSLRTYLNATRSLAAPRARPPSTARCP